jgi:hypothetical protein
MERAVIVLRGLELEADFDAHPAYPFDAADGRFAGAGGGEGDFELLQLFRHGHRVSWRPACGIADLGPRPCRTLQYRVRVEENLKFVGLIKRPAQASA